VIEKMDILNRLEINLHLTKDQVHTLIQAIELLGKELKVSEWGKLDDLATIVHTIRKINDMAPQNRLYAINVLYQINEKRYGDDSE